MSRSPEIEDLLVPPSRLTSSCWSVSDRSVVVLTRTVLGPEAGGFAVVVVEELEVVDEVVVDDATVVEDVLVGTVVRDVLVEVVAGGPTAGPGGLAGGAPPPMVGGV
jgi:hypothetical protein